jgi:PPOX class probable F420-dependent enzyme
VGHLEPALERRVAEAPVARLATVRPDGRPHIVPITFALDADTIVIAVDHKPKTTTDLQRLRNIGANPAVSVIVDHYEEDWSRLWWVRGDGAARVVEPGGPSGRPRGAGASWDEAIARLAEKYEPYRETPPRGPAIIVAVEHWTAWSP